MPSLLIVVLVLQLAIHLVNTVGAQAINDLVSPLPQTPRRDTDILDIEAMDPLQQSPDSALSGHAVANTAPGRSRPPEARDERYKLAGPVCEVGQAEETA